MLFKLMVDMMIFVLVGLFIVMFMLLLVLCLWFMCKGVCEWCNCVFEVIRLVYVKGLDFCFVCVCGIVLVLVVVLGVLLLLILCIGVEFMLYLDEGVLWVCVIMLYIILFDEVVKIILQICVILCSFFEVIMVINELGCLDDGIDFIGFFNVEFYVGFKFYVQWCGCYCIKFVLIEVMNCKLVQFFGIIFNYIQLVEDVVDEVEMGFKSVLVVKVFGLDLVMLQFKGQVIKYVLEKVCGICDVILVKELGQFSFSIDIYCVVIVCYGFNVLDINDLIQIVIGGDVVIQVVQGEKEFDLVVWFQKCYCDNFELIGNLLVVMFDGKQILFKLLVDIYIVDGVFFIYCQDNLCYVGVQFLVQGCDLVGVVGDVIV